jgi:hypothetical protein
MHHKAHIIRYALREWKKISASMNNLFLKKMKKQLKRKETV